MTENRIKFMVVDVATFVSWLKRIEQSLSFGCKSTAPKDQISVSVPSQPVNRGSAGPPESVPPPVAARKGSPSGSDSKSRTGSVSGGMGRFVQEF